MKLRRPGNVMGGLVVKVIKWSVMTSETIFQYNEVQLYINK